MGRIYNDIVETVGRTPLVRLNRVTEGLPANILLKCGFFNPLGSVIFGRIVGEELIRVVPELTPCFRTESAGASKQENPPKHAIASGPARRPEKSPPLSHSPTPSATLAKDSAVSKAPANGLTD